MKFVLSGKIGQAIIKIPVENMPNGLIVGKQYCPPTIVVLITIVKEMFGSCLAVTLLPFHVYEGQYELRMVKSVQIFAIVIQAFF